MANEFKTVFGIKHDAQIAYEEPLDSGFRNSYTALWEKFDAVEIDRHVYTLNVPLKLRPVELVSPAHRRRARARRRHWDEIVRSARDSLVKLRLFEQHHLPDPNSLAQPVEAFVDIAEIEAMG